MYISIDVGGSGIRVAASHSLTNLDFSESLLQSEISGSFEQDINLILKSARILGVKPFAAVGIGVTGTIDDYKSMVIQSVNNPYWNNNPIVEPIAKSLRCPVFLDNDAVATALGEVYYGHVDSDFAYIVWGTGIGGVLIKKTKNRVSVGNINQEWGKYFKNWHMACSGRAIVKKFNMRAAELDEPTRTLVFKDFTKYLRDFTRTFNVKHIVFGGGVASEFTAELEATVGDLFSCTVSKFDNQAGIYGAFGVIRYGLEGD